MQEFRNQYDAFRKEKTTGVNNPLLLVKLGEFYESFFEDAKVICEVLCTLPARREDGTHVILDAARLPEYEEKLKEAGYTPVIAVQNYRRWRYSDQFARGKLDALHSYQAEGETYSYFVSLEPKRAGLDTTRNCLEAVLSYPIAETINTEAEDLPKMFSFGW